MDQATCPSCKARVSPPRQPAGPQPLCPRCRAPLAVPPAGPAAAAEGPWQAARLHLRRALAWNIRGVPLCEWEKQFLTRRGVTDPTLQYYLAWRRSVLLVLALPAALIALGNTYDRLGGDLRALSPLGRLWVAGQVLLPYAIPAAVLGAAALWSHRDLSWRFLLHGWLASFLGPLLLYLVPADWLFDPDAAGARTEEDRAAFEAQVQVAFGLVLSLQLAGTFLVFLASLAAGAQRGCLRLKALFPKATLPGWLLVATAPVLPLFLFPAFVLINQVAGNAALLAGTALLMASSLAYALAAKAFIRPLYSARAFHAVAGCAGFRGPCSGRAPCSCSSTRSPAGCPSR